ncbi:MAG: excinuclease ABC subunit UvrA [Deltaproteobacteria bacterium]|nr:excinuclease ABC subunit UvrA [Deltaproteobacteria bacterium]
MDREYILVKGAREHNLKDVDVQIPRNQLVVVTGLSGSGKSSLAFDTVYAEGQRRYVESLSTYARQFLEQLRKPDVDSIEGLSPAVSVEQRTTSRNPRSTVGTITEIYDYMRLLFARVGVPHCPLCGREVESQTVQQMTDHLMALPAGTRMAILSPVVRGKKGEHHSEFEMLRRQGFTRVAVDGSVYDLGDEIDLDRRKQHDIDVYVDRLVVKKGIEGRLADSIELALKLADGIVKVSLVEQDEDLLFSEKFACVFCGVSFPDIEPRLFSFNNPYGACEKCGGLGTLMFFDPELLVPNDRLSLKEGAIAPWSRRSSAYFQKVLDALAAHYKFDLYTPFRRLPDKVRHVLLYGSGPEKVELPALRGTKTVKKSFEGVLPSLERKLREYEKKEKDGAGAGQDRGGFEEFRRYMNRAPCPECHGTRLRAEARAVLLGDRSIDQVTSLSVRDARTFFTGLELDDRQELVAGRVLKEIGDRLGFLDDVGLGYLTLDRSASTLSGGEAQRIRLATQIGSSLVGVLYILDEPSIGLHQRDNQRLLDTLFHLRDLGNTVLVVEHDEQTIGSADYVIDMGPGAGVAGGRVIAAGTPKEVASSTQSLTGAYLSGRARIESPKRRRKGVGGQVVLKRATTNNLDGITVRFPLGVLTCVTGVSGSGKSSLVVDTLLPAFQERLYHVTRDSGEYEELLGVHNVDKVIAIDQEPIGRTPRSNPATYTGLFTHVRELFAQLPESRMRGYGPGRFSFNVKGGRCEACEGDGILRIEMHFLPDVYVTCEVCGGKRYNRETLDIRYKGKSIFDVLEMTVNQASEFLANVPKVRTKLQTLQDVGLGYLKLGQPANTLSGGEAQRLKLSRELARKSTGSTFYILDEPTTGLHFADIERLLAVLNRLVDGGNTVVVIEHNLDVIKSADHIIDLGPEGGDEGGRLVVEGTPEDVARAKGSHTGRYLKKVL